jgi:hypothetical protein
VTRLFGLVVLLPAVTDVDLRQSVVDEVREVTKSIQLKDEEGFRSPLALASLIELLDGEERDAAVEECLQRLRLDYAGHEEALGAIVPYMSSELLKDVFRWLYETASEQGQVPLKLLPDIVTRVLPTLTNDEVASAFQYLISNRTRYPDILQFPGKRSSFRWHSWPTSCPIRTRRLLGKRYRNIFGTEMRLGPFLIWRCTAV